MEMPRFVKYSDKTGVGYAAIVRHLRSDPGIVVHPIIKQRNAKNNALSARYDSMDKPFPRNFTYGHKIVLPEDLASTVNRHHGIYGAGKNPHIVEEGDIFILSSKMYVFLVLARFWMFAIFKIGGIFSKFPIFKIAGIFLMFTIFSKFPIFKIAGIFWVFPIF
jgi:hypothetical protein